MQQQVQQHPQYQQQQQQGMGPQHVYAVQAGSVEPAPSQRDLALQAAQIELFMAAQQQQAPRQQQQQWGSRNQSSRNEGYGNQNRVKGKVGEGEGYVSDMAHPITRCGNAHQAPPTGGSRRCRIGRGDCR